MKKALIFISLSILLFSCKKQSQASIVGSWIEVSAYAESNGQYSWGPASKFPLRLWFDTDGKYSAFNDVPAGKGNYSFDYSTRELRFETANPISTSVFKVSNLDDSYLIIEYSSEYKLKFVRP